MRFPGFKTAQAAGNGPTQDEIDRKPPRARKEDTCHQWIPVFGSISDRCSYPVSLARSLALMYAGKVLIYNLDMADPAAAAEAALALCAPFQYSGTHTAATTAGGTTFQHLINHSPPILCMSDDTMLNMNSRSSSSRRRSFGSE